MEGFEIEMEVEAGVQEYILYSHAMIKKDSIATKAADIHDSQQEHSEILLSDKLKIFIPVANEYYHFIAETVTAFSVLAKENPGCVFLIFGKDLEGKSWWRSSMLSELLDKLSSLYGTQQIKLSRGSHFVKNLAVLPPHRARDGYLGEFYRAINHNKTDFPKPHRLVYISRSKTTEETKDGTLQASLTRRLKDEDILEDYFRSRGYEIVYAELLSTDEKIVLFRETKVLAAVTGAGLSNMAFMQPGSTVINITSYLANRGGGMSIHSGLYVNMAFYKSLMFISIPTDGKSSEFAKEELLKYEKIISQAEML